MEDNRAGYIISKVRGEVVAHAQHTTNSPCTRTPPGGAATLRGRVRLIPASWRINSHWLSVERQAPDEGESDRGSVGRSVGRLGWFSGTPKGGVRSPSDVHLGQSKQDISLTPTDAFPLTEDRFTNINQAKLYMISILLSISFEALLPLDTPSGPPTTRAL